MSFSAQLSPTHVQLGLAAFTLVQPYAYSLRKTMNTHLGLDQTIKNVLSKTVTFLATAAALVMIRPDQTMNRSIASIGFSLLGLFGLTSFGLSRICNGIPKELFQSYVSAAVPAAVVAHALPHILQRA